MAKTTPRARAALVRECTEQLDRMAWRLNEAGVSQDLLDRLSQAGKDIRSERGPGTNHEQETRT